MKTLGIILVVLFGWVIYSHSKRNGGTGSSGSFRCVIRKHGIETRIPDHYCAGKIGEVGRVTFTQATGTAPQDESPAVPLQQLSGEPTSVRDAVSPRDTFRAVSYWSRIPEEVLWGIYGHESGWSTSPTGVGQMAKSSGVHRALCLNAGKTRSWCTSAYDQAWAALKHMCTGQGRVVCDPNRVRMKWAGDTGPMQIIVQHVFEKRNGVFTKADWAVDADGDGVVNLFNLRDAVATAAKLLRRKYEVACKNSGMRCAVNLYWGSHGLTRTGKQYYYDVLDTARRTPPCSKRKDLCRPLLDSN